MLSESSKQDLIRLRESWSRYDSGNGAAELEWLRPGCTAIGVAREVLSELQSENTTDLLEDLQAVDNELAAILPLPTASCSA